MNDYPLSGAAVLSYDNIAGTDNLIASAIELMPSSAVNNIVPVAKVKGPASTWVEPLYEKDKIKLVKTPIQIGENRQRLEFTTDAMENLRHTYQPENVLKIIQGWVKNHKYENQAEQLMQILESPEFRNLDSFGNPITINPQMTDDVVEIVKARITAVVTAITRDWKIGEMDFSVVGPYEVAWAVLDLQTKVPGKIHFMGDDKATSIYVFPTGTDNTSRAGFCYFEYSDEVMRTLDPDSGDEVYFLFNRAKMVVNPIHTPQKPLIRRIGLQ